jgi:hypothetical protein
MLIVAMFDVLPCSTRVRVTENWEPIEFWDILSLCYLVNVKLDWDWILAHQLGSILLEQVYE